MTTAAEAKAELDRAHAQFPATHEDSAVKWLRHQMAAYRDALRVIASGELTRNKAVQAANAALQKGETYRLLARAHAATPFPTAKKTDCR